MILPIDGTAASLESGVEYLVTNGSDVMYEVECGGYGGVRS
jgi:hypothetical protein